MSPYIKKFLFATVLMAGCFFINSARAVSLSPTISNIIDSHSFASSDSLVKVVLFAENNNQLTTPRKIAAQSNLNFRMKHKLVIENLKNASDDILGSIAARVRALNPHTDIKRFWIAPALSFEIPASKIEDLLDIDGVLSIIEDGTVESMKPVELPTVAKTNGTYDHLISMNVPTLWRAGITGTGRLICSFDTGVDGTHPALKDKWHGNSSTTEASWFAPRLSSDIPADPVGHGTQTMGIMVGGTDTDTIGVAPDAEWISAAVIDQGQTLSNTVSDIISAFQWVVDPDGNPETVDDMPDVVLNSWGIPTTIMEPCDESFDAVIDNVEAAGIVTIFAAGNEGPSPYSLRLPANRASSPLNAFAVGAIDHNTNLVASFSSRGPSSCDSSSIKPEVVAPGVGIYTTAKGGGYRYSTGTSMSAPIIAGIVTLMRQYNPEVTVEEIKTALIKSATDLGTSGEDNNYGHGLPDAAKAIALLPRPTNPDIIVNRTIIDNDGIADPGETFNYYVMLGAVANSFDSLTGYIITNSSKVTVIDNQAPFIFAPGSPQSANLSPFILRIDEQALHGDKVKLYLAVDLPFGIPYDTLELELTIGTSPNGNLLTHVTSKMEITVSDFGQFGMAENSIYPAGGRGLRFNGSDNLMYEAGIIVGRNALQMASSVRNELGRADQSDFNPVADININYTASTEGYTSDAEFIDSGADIQIPITIEQTVVNYNTPGDEQYMIFRYFLKNTSVELLTDLSFGFFADFDLDAGGDRAGAIAENNLYYQFSDLYTVGVMALSNLKGMETINNGSSKLPLTNQDKIGFLNFSGVGVDESSVADFMSVLSFGPYNIQPGDSVEVAFAIAVGADLNEVQYFANRAAEKYFGFTDITDYVDFVPARFELGQNYPNPFNPSTTISFQMSRAAQAKLTVINILGQEVAVLFDDMAQTGVNTVRWDGVDENGSKVASGVYFYRLQTETEVETRKMLLVK